MNCSHFSFALNQTFFFKGVLKNPNKKVRVKSRAGINVLCSSEDTQLFPLGFKKTSTYYPCTISSIQAVPRGKFVKSNARIRSGSSYKNIRLNYSINLLRKKRTSIYKTAGLESGFLSKRYSFFVIGNRFMPIPRKLISFYKTYLYNNNGKSLFTFSPKNAHINLKNRYSIINAFDFEKKASLANKLFYINLHKNNGKFSLKFSKSESKFKYIFKNKKRNRSRNRKFIHKRHLLVQ